MAWPATFVPRLWHYSNDTLECACASRLVAHSPKTIYKHRASPHHTPCVPSHDIVMQCDSEGSCGTCLTCHSDVAIQPTADGLCTCQTALPTNLLLIARLDHAERWSLLYQSVLSFTPHANASEHPSRVASVRMDRDGSLGSTARDGVVCDADTRSTLLRLPPYSPFRFPLTSRARISFGRICKVPETERGCPTRGQHCTSCVCRCALRTVR